MTQEVGGPTIWQGSFRITRFETSKGESLQQTKTGRDRCFGAMGIGRNEKTKAVE